MKNFASVCSLFVCLLPNRQEYITKTPGNSSLLWEFECAHALAGAAVCVCRRMPRLQLVGTVVSDKMEKTAVVLVKRLVQHPLLGKYVNKSKRFMAHDEGTER